jgi:YggT family protein
MDALRYIVETLFGLYLLVLLLRLLMQITRADFRNPVARAVVQLTDPLILPLRRVLPAMGKIDTASVVAIILVSVLKLVLIQLLFAVGFPNPFWLARFVLLDLIRLVLQTYLFAIFVYAILSFVAPGNYSPAQSLLASICEPVLRPVRQRIPAVAGLDLSPLWVCIAIGALMRLLP